MELIDHFRRQFAYNEWANREVLATLRDTAGSLERPIQYVAHILSAELLWLNRDGNRALCEHFAQRFPKRDDDRVERLAQAVVSIGRELRRSFRRCGKGRQLAGRGHADMKQALGMKVS